MSEHYYKDQVRKIWPESSVRLLPSGRYGFFHSKNLDKPDFALWSASRCWQVAHDQYCIGDDVDKLKEAQPSTQ